MNLNFTFKSFLLIFLSGLYPIIINVPGDYPTIQGALDASQDGDIIEVGSGTYTENIIIESGVTLRSSSGAGSTTIDGSGQTGVMSSTITVRPSSGSATIPQNIEIDGFTITGGIGNEMKKQETMPNGSLQTTIERKGGGIMAYNTSPKVINNNINGNGSNSQTSNGGGIVAIDGTEDWSFNDREYEINPELPPTTDPLDLSANIFLNNQSHYAKSVYVEGYADLITDLSGGYFDCFSSEYQAVSEYWVNGDETEFNFSNIDAEYDSITSYDVYIDPVNGIDQFTNEWNGDESHPFKTIDFALSMIYASPEYSVTIYLFEGTYSLSENGESYPINIPTYVNLIGRSQTAKEIILDGEGQAEKIITLTYNETYNNIISNMTITGTGNINDLGSITVWRWTPSDMDSYIYLDRLLIHSNMGGGIYLGSVNAILSNITVVNNQRRGLQTAPNSNVYVYNSIFWGNLLAQQQGVNGLNIAINDGTNIWIPNWETANASLYIDNSTIDPYQDASGICMGYLDEDYVLDMLIMMCSDIGFDAESCYAASEFLSEEYPFLEGEAICEYIPEEGGCFLSEFAMNFNIDSNSCPEYSFEECGGPDAAWCEFYHDNSGELSYGDSAINSDPLFADQSYELTSQSPCIDTGTSVMEYSNGYIEIPENMYVDGNGDGISAPDMGAIEYIPEGHSYDINSDGSTNIQDVVLLVSIVLGYSESIPGSDINEDGSVNVNDIVMLVTYILNN